MPAVPEEPAVEGTLGLEWANRPGLGAHLVDPEGRSLYVYVGDRTPGVPPCESRCAVAWPPLTLPRGLEVAGPNGWRR